MRCGTSAAPASPRSDPDRAELIDQLAEFVALGLAEWRVLENARLQIRFATGEQFLLAYWGIVRLA
jgi:hypothetical protein